MAKEVAPTKLTGGGGFEFEDKVAAFFMCYLLSERPPLDPSFGVIKRIAFQVRADGWLLDDLLLTLRNGNQERRCAFSIKSNVQFSKTSAPSDFVKAAWEQNLGEVTSPFERGRDRIGLITSPLDIDTKTKLEGLLQKARSQDSDELSSRIKEDGYISKEGRSIFESFSCPPDLAEKYPINETNIGELLKHIEHLEFDFEHTSSSKVSDAIGILRGILESSSFEEARNLWDSLCAIGRGLKTSGGYIDLGVLVGELRNRYRLKDFPDHASTWETIKIKSKEEIDLIRDKIADIVSIDRSSVLSDINKKLAQNNILVLLGDSGSGKTVIEKTIAESNFDLLKVVWINAENLQLLEDIPSLEIFKVIPDQTAFLIIDALDRFYDGSTFKKIALLLKACRESTGSSPWKIIISCQPEEWSRVQVSLSKLNVNTAWETINIQNPSDNELETVWQTYPLLRSLSLHLHLRPFIFKLKVLDLIARRISAGGTVDPESWVGESSLINWYWEEEVKAKPDGLSMSVVLKQFAEKLADNMSFELPETAFSINEIPVIQELIKARILKRRSDRISFEHDLVADWTRQRILLEKYPNVFEYVKDKLTSPMWCKALKLLGIHLLEKGTDIEEWKGIFYSFGGENEQGNLAQDLLLESSIFSATPLNNLEKQWDELQKNDGTLLRRLLNRFFYSASFPNQLALLIARQYKDEATSDLITRYRNPYWLYWIPVINFLHNHRTETTKLAQKQVAEIVDKWLRFSKKDWPARVKAAEIAIEMAEDILALKMSKIMLFDKSGIVNLVFRAGLASCNEQPDRTIDFALTACSRKDPTGRLLELIVKYNEEVRSREKKMERPRAKIPSALLSSCYESEPPPPWPEGPQKRVDRDFHEICLESITQNDALSLLISSFPEKAREIILALLIEEPTPRDRHRSRMKEYFGLTFVRRWFPPFYTRGPFYYFLNKHPEKGLDLILTLINFATQRWSEQWSAEGDEPPYIEIEFKWGIKKFIGDAHVYYWHRDGGLISHIISSALMALEKWFYDRLENKDYEKELIKHIEKVLKEGTSLSFIGLLISIGKKNPTLFSSHLFSFLAVPELYSWDMQHILVSETDQMIGWFNRGEMMIKLAQGFHSMPHRKTQLNEIAMSLFHSDEDTRRDFEEFRLKWKDRFDKSQFDTVDPETLENLIQWFDISNWKTETDQENRKILIKFEMPKEIVERREVGFKELQDRQLLIYLPTKFRRILNGEEKLSPDEAIKIWNTMQHVSSIIQAEDDPDRDVLNKNNSICGGIAVLFKYFRGWLKQEPDKEKWCIEKITQLIQSPPPERPFDSGMSTGHWIWDRFCAEVMPNIWVDDPKNLLYRECMAILATNKHYETVTILFRSASGLRATLNKHFKQLIHFLLKWSHAKWKYRHEQYTDKRSFDISKWLEQEVNAFKKVTYPTEPIIWELIAQEEMKRVNKLYETEKKKKGEPWKPPKEDYFDLWLMKAAFSWMPSLDQASDKNEREEWVRFWKQALIWTVNILELDDDGEISGTPSDWDTWLFERIAIQVLCMNDSERPVELLQPILNLGGEGHYWVEDFIMEWFMKGIRVETISDNFIKRWKEMLEYAFNSEKWSFQEERQWYYRTKLWCELLGMNNIISELWDERKKPIIREMKQYYERWANTNLPNPESAVMFVDFLMRPALEPILIDGLIWLEKAANEAGDDFFTNRHDNVQKPLADLLEISWKKYKTQIQSNSDAYKAFMNLLMKLVDFQVPQAIEIQQNLA